MSRVIGIGFHFIILHWHSIQGNINWPEYSLLFGCPVHALTTNQFSKIFLHGGSQLSRKPKPLTRPQMIIHEEKLVDTGNLYAILVPGLHSVNGFYLFKGMMQNIVQWLPLAVLLYFREIQAANSKLICFCFFYKSCAKYSTRYLISLGTCPFAHGKCLVSCMMVLVSWFFFFLLSFYYCRVIQTTRCTTSCIRGYRYDSQQETQRVTREQRRRRTSCDREATCISLI